MTASMKPAPNLDPDSRPYWEAIAKGEFRAQRCDACQQLRHYPRLLCPNCWSDEATWVELPHRGTVYSYTIVHRAPSPAFRADVPYTIGLIDIAPGVRVFAGLDPSESGRQAEIGDQVDLIFRASGPDVTLPYFKVVDPPRDAASTAGSTG